MSRRIVYVFSAEGTADVTRAVQGIAAVHRRVQGEMRGDSARTVSGALADARRLVAGERTAQAQRRVVVSATYEAWKRAEAALTDAVGRGAHDRERIAAREAAARKAHLDSLKVSWREAESTYTRIVMEESRRRDQARGRERGGGRGGGGGGGGDNAGSSIRAAGAAVFQAGQTMHGAVQDARRTRAENVNTLGAKLSEAGASRGDIEHLYRVAQARVLRHGMRMEDVATAAAQAQTESSVLGNADEMRSMTPEARRSLLERRVTEQVEAAAAARNMGADPGEMIRLRGMFAQQGIAGAGIDELLSRTVAMAQRGAIEPGAVTRTAMQPIIARMNGALAAMPANATQEERQRVLQNTYVQEFAQLQVLRSRGYNPRNAANIDASMAQAFQGNVTAERMRDTLTRAASTATGARRAQLQELLGENGLFEADPAARGRMRLRDAYRGNPLAVAAQLSASGLSTTDAAGIFAGGGRGNPQALQRNWNAMLTALAARDVNGRSGAELVKEISQSRLSSGDRGRMADFFENSDLAQLNRNEESRVQALTDNTSALVRMSNRIADWMAAHPAAGPVGSAVLGAGGNLVGGLLGGALGGGGGAGGAAAAGAGRLLPFLAGTGGIALGTVAAAAGMGLALSSARDQYWANQGLLPGDVDWLGNPTVVGGMTSIRAAQEEHQNLRLQRFDASVWSMRAPMLAREQDAAQAYERSPAGQRMLREMFGAPAGEPGSPTAPNATVTMDAAGLQTLATAFSTALRTTPITVNVDPAQAQHADAAPPAPGAPGLSVPSGVFTTADGR